MANIVTEKNLRFEITGGKKKERLDIFLANSIENATRTKVQDLIKADYVRVNKRKTKPSYILIPGDVIDVKIPVSPRPEYTEPENIPLNIVYEDKDVLIVNKPAGMVVHPGFSNYTGTLVSALLYYTKDLSLGRGFEKAGIVHRIDKETSGLLIVAKNDFAHEKIAKQFFDHSIEREYWAIVWGSFFKKEGVIEASLGRSKRDRKKIAVVPIGKHAVTYYEVMEEYDFLSLLKLRLKTGRTHQIRVHLAHSHHPVFGDPTYGGRRIHGVQLTASLKQYINNLLSMMPRQALHAKTIGFIHPTTQKYVFFDSPLPDDMKELMQKLRSAKNSGEN